MYSRFSPRRTFRPATNWVGRCKVSNQRPLPCWLTIAGGASRGTSLRRPAHGGPFCWGRLLSRSNGSIRSASLVWQLSGGRFVLFLLLVAVLPFGIDFGGKFSAANQLLQVSDDGAPGDFELAGQRGNVRALVGRREHLADLSLPAQAIGRATEQFLDIHALGAFQRLELSDNLRFATFLEGGLDRASQFVQIERFGDAVVGAARSLERGHLLMNLQRAGNHNDRHVGHQFLQLAQVVQTQFAVGQDVIEEDQVRRRLRDGSQRVAGGGGADQLVFGQRFFVNLVLQIVVLDDENALVVHGLGTI